MVIIIHKRDPANPELKSFRPLPELFTLLPERSCPPALPAWRADPRCAIPAPLVQKVVFQADFDFFDLRAQLAEVFETGGAPLWFLIVEGDGFQLGGNDGDFGFAGGSGGG
jgi:hypothetical protein